MSITMKAVVGTVLLLSGMYIQELWQWFAIPAGFFLLAMASVKEREQ